MCQARIHVSILWAWLYKEQMTPREEPFWAWQLEICPDRQSMIIIQNLGTTPKYKEEN